MKEVHTIELLGENRNENSYIQPIRVELELKNSDSGVGAAGFFIMLGLLSLSASITYLASH